MSDEIQEDKTEEKKDGEWGAFIGGCIIMIVLAAIAIGLLYVLWLGVTWVWDAFIGFVFDGGGGGGRLAEYCAGKWGSSPLYRECINDGWKPWYANASWMK